MLQGKLWNRNTLIERYAVPQESLELETVHLAYHSDTEQLMVFHVLIQASHTPTTGAE
jgi:hypothetical protein